MTTNTDITGCDRETTWDTDRPRDAIFDKFQLDFLILFEAFPYWVGLGQDYTNFGKEKKNLFTIFMYI